MDFAAAFILVLTTSTQELLQHLLYFAGSCTVTRNYWVFCKFYFCRPISTICFTQLIIANNADDAQYIQNDLQNLLEKKKSFFAVLL